MNNKVTPAARVAFRDFLRGELRQLEFYQKRGNHYLIREFAKYCVEQETPFDEASLGRYLRDDEPVLPTPERCRQLARVLKMSPLRLLAECGYLTAADVSDEIPADIPAEELAELVAEGAAVAWHASKEDMKKLVRKSQKEKAGLA